MFTLDSENGENVVHMVRCDGVTHFSVAVGGSSDPSVDVADVAARADNQGGTCVDDGLAAARAGHSLPVNGDAARGRGREWVTVTQGCCLTILWLVELCATFSFQLSS